MLHKIQHALRGMNRANGLNAYLNSVHVRKSHHCPTTEEAKRDYYEALRAASSWNRF